MGAGLCRRSSASPAAGADAEAILGSKAAKVVPSGHRARRSVALDQQEVERSKRASERFAAGGHATAFTLADRGHWQAFQALLDNTVQEGSTAHVCEVETEADRALTTFGGVVDAVLVAVRKRAAAPNEEAFLENALVSTTLKDCLFVGHVATDMDSIAGAIGAARLFGGIAAKAEAELNGEIKYVLSEVAKMDEPPLFDEVPGGSRPDASGQLKKVCLVDHNEEKQMVPAMRADKDRKKRIVGLIDHHAVAESFSSDSPLLVDVRPWGSMSSIVAHMYVRNNVLMPPEVARVLLCAILSDTLNLQSVTTTNADRFCVALLARLGGIEDPDEVARLMFRAKTNWIVNLGPYAMVRGDQKDFVVDGWKFGCSVLEVTDMAPVLESAWDLILELRILKKEKGAGVRAQELDFAFVFVVDVVRQCSVLLVCGGREYALAAAAFPGCPFGRARTDMEDSPGSIIKVDQTLCDVGPLVSRKAQFVPAFSRVLSAGFTCHKERVSSPNYKQDAKDEALDQVLANDLAKVVIDGSQRLSRKSAVKPMMDAVFGG